jgi:hypothetical protein
MSGNDMTASSPRAAAVAAMVTAVMYPSVRIVCLLFLRLIGVSGPTLESPVAAVVSQSGGWGVLAWRRSAGLWLGAVACR